MKNNKRVMGKSRTKSRNTPRKGYNPNMTFQGEAKLFLNCDTMEEFLEKCTFTGDWVSAKQRKRILGKDRWYRICLYLFDDGGNPFHSSNHPDVRVDADGLIKVQQVLLQDIMKDYPETTIDKDASYSVVSVPKRKDKK